jgi:Carboxypeptidase regulatory-like domain/TonB dependent receptor
MERKRLVVAYAFVSFLLAVCGNAQLNRGTLTGTVTDVTGAVVPACKITARNTATGAVYQTETNTNGQYSIPNTPTGSYELTFESAAFKRLVRSGIDVGATEVVRVDTTLEIGSVTESVQITAEAPRLQSDTPEVGTSLNNRELVDLPISWSGEGRMPENFAYKISPGVAGNTWTSHINGSTSFSKETLLDGATVTTYLSGHFGEGAVSTEAVQEFKIQTSGMAAEFGRSQGGIFNYVMKSGANAVHGSLYGSLRNEAFNANTWVNNFRGVPRTPDRKQNYAGSFGGPVYIPKVYDGRNKTFFYSAYERYKERTLGFGAPSITLPLPEFLQGDFSRLLGPATGQKDALGRDVLRGAIYDPLTFKQLDNGRWVGEPFERNQVPTNRFSQVSQRLNSILQKYYLPTERDATGQIPLVNNASALVSQQPQFDYYMFSTKADQIISNKQKLSGSYSYAARPRMLIDRTAVWSPLDSVGGPLAKSRFQRVKTDLARMAHDYSISPRLLNFFTVYYNRQINPSIGTAADVNGASELGIKGLSTYGYPNIEWNSGPFVALSNAGYTSKGNIANVGWGFLDTVSFSHDRHFMKAGFDFRRNHLNTQPTQGGTLRFNPRGTAIPNEPFSGNLTGYAFASYLLGIVDSAALSDPIGLGGRRHYYGMFFQDDFKVSTKLTLNLGVRWEYQPPATEVADRLSSWNPNKIDPLSGLPGAYDFAGDCSVCTGKSYFGRRSLRDWGPRIGFAWQPLDRWAIRGAYGIFYEGDLFNNFDGTPRKTDERGLGRYLVAGCRPCPALERNIQLGYRVPDEPFRARCI